VETMRRIFFDVETTGLDAIRQRILCICCIVKTETEEKMIDFCDEDETKLLNEFWNYINPNEDLLISFNGDTFDIPFIYKRSIINRVRVKKLNKNFCQDLRKVVNSFFFCFSKYERGTLSEWASHLGFTVETDDGSKMPILFANKDWKGILDHCHEDIKITKALYDRCEEVGIL
jgi:uncharacterized protein YprB with RNaseH-like and TPR domain